MLGFSARLKGARCSTAARRAGLCLAAPLLLGVAPAAAQTVVDTTIHVTNPAIFGAADIIMDGGSLIFDTNATLSNDLFFSPGLSSTIAAATGRVVEFGPAGAFSGIAFDTDVTAVFGTATDTGTVVINSDFSLPDLTAKIVVAGGTLTGGAAFVDLLALAESTTVNSGATLLLQSGLNGIHNLKGDGSVVTDPGGSLLLLFVDPGSSSEFAGVISGDTDVEISNTFFGGAADATMILSGDNTYTGGTTICACSILQLGSGGTSGSILGDVANGGTLAFNRSDTYVFNGTIFDDFFDPGRVVQMGPGTTVLTAANTYSGGTTITRGTLRMDNASALGTGGITMSGGTLLSTVNAAFTSDLRFNGGKTSTIAATAGKVLRFDPLFGFSTLALDAGSTAVFGSPTATGTVVLDSGSTTVDPTSKIVVAGGTLLGASTTLGGILIETASTTVNAGATLDFGDDSGGVHNLKGAGNVVIGKTSPLASVGLALLVDPSSSTEFSGVISGFGSVATLNLGAIGTNATVVLSGNNTYLGGTFICSCTTLQLGNGGTTGSILGDVVNGGTLAFNRSDIYVFNGAIQDDTPFAGKLVQMGPGTTVLTANNTYTGTTSVLDGKLVVNGSIASSATTVFSGAELGGTGTLGSVTVRAGGLHAPGNSIGTQTVNGAYMLSAGSALAIELNAAGQSDKVVVRGTVNLTGSILRVLAAAGSYDPNKSYLIIDNDGTDAVGRGFAQVTSNLLFLAPSVSYTSGTGNDVVLKFVRNGTKFTTVSKTTNQYDVATALDKLPITDPLFPIITNLTEDAVATAFDALSGEVHASLAGVLLEDSRYLREALLGRLMQAFYAGKGAALGSGGPVAVSSLDQGRMALGAGSGAGEASPAASGLTFWTHAFGAWGDFDATAGTAAVDRSLGGVVSGMDALLGGSWRVGLATGYEQSNSTLSAHLSTAEVESYHLAAYAGGGLGPLALRSGAAWTWLDIETDRMIAFPGFIQNAHASYDGDRGQVFGEVALPFVSGRTAVEPFAGLAYIHVETDSFIETGSIAALSSAGADEDISYSTLGLRAATTMEANGLQIAPRVSAAWQHAFDEVTPGIALAFASSGVGFGITGVPLATDSALIEAGLDLALSPQATLGLSYTGQLAEEFEDHGIKGNFTWQF